MKKKKIAKIGTKEDRYWLQVMDRFKAEVEALEMQLKLSKAIIQLCRDKTIKIKEI